MLTKQKSCLCLYIPEAQRGLVNYHDLPSVNATCAVAEQEQMAFCGRIFSAGLHHVTDANSAVVHFCSIQPSYK